MNLDEIERFYADRDVRTIAYGSDRRALGRAIHIVAGQSATTRPGQVALLALANMAARTHRRIELAFPDAPLLAYTLVPADRLADAASATLLAINPALILTINGRRVDDHDIAIETFSAVEPTVRVGIGNDVAGCDIHLGWNGGRGELSFAPIGTGEGELDVIGAATAACLGAAAVFHLSHSRPVTPVQVNLVERAARSSISLPGQPEQIATASILGPIDVGRIAVIGAGALSHALAYWAAELGHLDSWNAIDADVAELSNTNRCLAMTAADAGWPGGRPVGTARDKAQIVADILAGAAATLWYDQWAATNPPRADLVLPLANERGIRAGIAALGEPVLIHATTSPQWTAELHLHRPDIDDCPACRIPDLASPVFDCSTGPAVLGDVANAGDAALPFLSAAAGLMLLIAITQLRLDEALLRDRHNHWRLCFESAVALRASVHSRGGCPHTLPALARTAIQRADPARHDLLDLRRSV